MYFLFCDDSAGDKQVWYFNTMEELTAYIQEETPVIEEMVIRKLDEMLVIEGRELEVTLKELKYVKELEIKYKEEL